MFEPNEMRIPPHDLEMEKVVIASAMINREACDYAIDVLRPEDFYSSTNQYIFKAIVSLSARNKPTDLVSVANDLKRRDLNDYSGIVDFLGELGGSVPTTANINHHCEVVKDKSKLRDIINISQETLSTAYSPDANGNDLLDATEGRILTLSTKGVSKVVCDFKSILGRSMDAIRHIVKTGKKPGLSTGLVDVDELTTGYHKGDLIIGAGRPGMGKSGYALHNAVSAANKGMVVSMSSLEMPSDQLAQRIISNYSSVQLSHIRGGLVSGGDLNRMELTAEKIEKMPIYIDDTPGLNVMQIRSNARRVKSTAGRLDLIIIDYLQLMSSVEKIRNRDSELGQITKALKGLAKELEVPVLALSQLSRKCEERGKNKRPILSDLRESGNIEQDADMVIFLYRDEIYNKKSDFKNSCEVIVGKHRNGPVGMKRVGYNGEYQRFYDLSNRIEEPDNEAKHWCD